MPTAQADGGGGGTGLLAGVHAFAVLHAAIPGAAFVDNEAEAPVHQEDGSLQAASGICRAPVRSQAVGLVRLAASADREDGDGGPIQGRAVHVLTDVCGLEGIHAESGWYEGWLVHDLRVPRVAPKLPDGRAPFGTITQADADVLREMGDGRNVPGAVFTRDGHDVRIPGIQGAARAPGAGGTPAGNTVFVPVSAGTWNTLAATDGHAHGALRPSTNRAFPAYETAATGGVLRDYVDGKQYAPLGGLGPSADSRIPGSGPAGVVNASNLDGKARYGDHPLDPRDADRGPLACGLDELAGPGPARASRGARGLEGLIGIFGGLSRTEETRLRGIPSGLTREVLLEAFLRPVSAGFGDAPPERRVMLAYARIVGRFDRDGDGMLGFDEVRNPLDPEGPDGARSPEEDIEATDLYLPVDAFDRFVVTREIDDGLLAPRFAPATSAHVLTGVLVRRRGSR